MIRRNPWMPMEGVLAYPFDPNPKEHSCLRNWLLLTLGGSILYPILWDRLPDLTYNLNINFCWNKHLSIFRINWRCIDDEMKIMFSTQNHVFPSWMNYSAQSKRDIFSIWCLREFLWFLIIFRNRQLRFIFAKLILENLYFHFYFVYFTSILLKVFLWNHKEREELYWIIRE